MPYADLASLMQVAPYAASGFIAQNQALDQQSNELKQKELEQLISARTQDQQFAAQRQPFELDKLRLGNQGLSLNNDATSLTNQFNQATQPGKIATTNTENATKVSDIITSHFPDLANTLDNTPDLAKPQAFASWLDQQNVPDKAKQAFLSRYTNVPPGQLPAMLRADADRLLKANPKYLEQELQNKGNKEVANIHAAGARDAARISSEGRIQAATARAQQILGVESQLAATRGNPISQYTILRQAATQAEMAGDRIKAQEYAQRMEAVRPAAEALLKQGPKAGSPDLSAIGGIPTNPTPSLPGAGTPAPNPAPQADTMSAAAQKAWGAYEPDKYDYRVGPNGNLQRKPK